MLHLHELRHGDARDNKILENVFIAEGENQKHDSPEMIMNQYSMSSSARQQEILRSVDWLTDLAMQI